MKSAEAAELPPPFEAPAPSYESGEEADYGYDAKTYETADEEKARFKREYSLPEHPDNLQTELPRPVASGSGSGQEAKGKELKYLDAEAHSFHVYNHNWYKSKDDLITGDDKEPIYYLQFQRPAASFVWNMFLHSGSRDGAVVATLNRQGSVSEGRLRRFHFTLQETGEKVELEAKAWYSMDHSFNGISQENKAKRFVWRKQPWWTDNLVCENVITKEVVAHFRKSGSVAKAGQLRIDKAITGSEILLFLCGGLAIVELAAERR